MTLMIIETLKTLKPKDLKTSQPHTLKTSQPHNKKNIFYEKT